jgi:hypothetical protein
MSDDLKLDEAGNIEYNSYVESLKNEIANGLKNEFSNYVGCTIGQVSKTEVNETVKKVLEDTFRDTIRHVQGVSEVPEIKTDILWNKMSFKEKAVWFSYRHIFKKKAQLLRSTIDEMNAKNPDGPRFNYPPILEPNPKQILVFDAKVKFGQPVEFVMCDIIIENK